MSILIESNSFTMDLRNTRLSRLWILKNNINNYASELCITPEILDWANLAFDEYKSLLDEQYHINEEKNLKFIKIKDLEKEFFQRFTSLREIINPLITDSNQKIFLKLNEQIPAKRTEKIEFAAELLKNIEPLPIFNNNEMSKIVIQNLVSQLQILKESYGNALILQEQAENLTNRINKRFEQDTINFKTLYNWCVIFWSKKDFKLTKIGFVIPKVISKQTFTPDRVMNFIFEDNVIKWDKESKSLTYQLVYKSDNSKTEWTILYDGELNFIENELLSGEYKVRGINNLGFGQWSESIFINE